MAVIDTNTWTWTTQYKGAPLNSIWPRVTNDRGEDNKGNGTDNAGQSDGLSTGAKGGIGAGVALLVVGLALGLFFYRKKRLRRGNQKNGSNFPQQPLYEKDQRNQQHGNHNHYSHNNQSDVNHLMHGRGSEHPSPTGSGPEVVSQSGSGMPVMYHAAYTTDGYGGGAMPATVVRPDAYPLPPPSSSTALAAGAAFPLNVVPNVIPPPINGASRPPNNVNLVYAPPPLPNQGTLDDAALAAALYQAEDSLSSTRSLSPAYTSASLSHLNHPTMSQHQYPANVNASYIDSPLRSQDNHPPTSPMSLYSYPTSKSSGPVSSKVSSSSVALSSAHPSSQSQVSSTLSRVPTIHTPVISTILAPDADGNNSPRQPLGPQSVPEKEAWIERSSPGVRTQLVNARDLDADGLYKPLTPTRVHGSHSILVGAPASHVASNANSFAAASSSLKFSPAGHAGQMTGDGAENGKEGRAAHEGKAHGQSLVSNSGVRPMTGTSSTSYRDPQMMKDLDDIARMIETQALTETKSPHTIVSSPLSQSEGREGR
ncbi:hypothetical protein BX616_005106 [Lobosporangium transversale]|nr:hypothetical protein BX616_005106 [Lobosporangium transversale]